MTIYLQQLDSDMHSAFPSIESALTEPDGLLAMGGDLSANRLINAYQHGIFPWYSEGDPILWWSPSIRGVFLPRQFSPSKSLKKYFRKSNYRITINTVTEQIIELCASTRGPEETWIMPEMIFAYKQLAALGYCHSVEVWENETLIGGLYGLQIGQIFCGESMFSLKTNASKIALWKFCEHFSAAGGELIDCQMMNPHLESLGATEMNRSEFKMKLGELTDKLVAPSCYAPQSIGNKP
ncbi:leucyl/phenylalanyl-tRNA--protein transferase [Aliivibrio sp. S2TY2]|uniref:leucyl/phenylalanyl-tRNA--protein transferase n=1 Tax=unclassified Aliivibrio TaxID=2645654 RepID=UPI002379FB7A|nr:MULTISPECIES: leucyl/phenylalanyl-tRNA--protein transferase [unclassified Aliivibrio]MDD9174657.1 leucyl/phenylalanyl-tRNA--protein transferase [Aliivibrio sp. S3TY1]MDD9191736.1 leucyl/phenylalanyl-tRNA--protein transferase [Aliivibrio sp. S2TY2]